MVDKYSKKNIEKIKESPSPKILLNVCTHGSERVGLKIAKALKDLKPLRGTLVINVANELAVAKKKRFIDEDLNRVFPGKKTGNHEQKLAYAMKPFVEAFDVVLDIHSTETDLRSALIVTDYSREVKPLLKAISPKRVIFMTATKSNTLISSAKIGIGFEYGNDKSEKTYTETVKGIEQLLGFFNMINVSKKRKAKHIVEFFEADSIVPKPDGFEVVSSITNFKMVKKGTIIGHNSKTKENIFAEKDFYPILFGKNSYKTMFGFSAKKKIF
jgi:succinylglutamate desuccinylase